MFRYANIKQIEVALTNACNAACPQCPRNVYGGKTLDNLPHLFWTLNSFKKVFTANVLNHIQTLYFCGTYGDPLACKDLIPICHYVKESAPRIKLGIHTNGGLKGTNIFKKLATYVDTIAFGIDGLSDTNHLYRRNVVWSKVIANATAYIQSGGDAVWDYIVFRHNQHQVSTARTLSKELGFSKFNIKRTSRFFNKAHKLVDSVDVQNMKGEYEYSIYPPTDKEYYNPSLDTWHNLDTKEYLKTTCITCHSMHNYWIYVDESGYIFPCGWTSDRMYGYEAEQTSDYHKIRELMNDAGLHNTNVMHNTLENIVNGPWLQSLKESWTNENRLERCAVMCGSKVNLISDQNKDADIIVKSLGT